jgi:TPR repeat protein
MPRLLAAICASLAILLVAASAQADAERRVALVIGNQAYQHLPRLSTPNGDAQLIATTLQKLGFELIGGGAQTDLDRAGFEKVIRQFGAALRGGSVGLFYYAGHGVAVGGVNFLVPVGANPVTVQDVDYELISADLVLKQMEAAGSKLNIIVLDACRNNPFGGRGLREAGQGLATMRAARGTLISYATQPGNVAADGAGHSPYTAVLADVMRRPGLEVWKVFNEVAVAVDKATGGAQQPWISSSPLEGTFYFATAAATPPPAATNPTPAAPPGVGERPRDLVFWEAVQSSSDPADYEEFVRRFPQSELVSLAQRRLAALRAPRSGAAPAPSAPTAPADPEAGWSVDDRRAVQQALHALGHFHGGANGTFDAATRTAIKQFQSFDGAPETGKLSEAERRKLLDMATRLAALLSRPAASPLGVAANTVNGATQRYARAFAFDKASGGPRNPAEAAYWYALAAADGEPKAFTNLGMLIAKGDVNPNGGLARGLPVLGTQAGGSAPPNTDAAGAAVLLWWAAAARGEVTAMRNISVAYKDGLGVPADTERAQQWLQRAALLAAPAPRPPAPVGEESWSLDDKREVQRALRLLGHFAGEPSGNFDASTRLAIKQFQSFAGNPESGTLTEAERRQLLDMGRRLAELLRREAMSPQGITAAAVAGNSRYERAIAFDQGSGGRQRDPAEAGYWYALAAADGNRLAFANLGTLMAGRDGVSGKNPTAAPLLWWAAAARGEAIAMYNLGAAYERGIGVAADPARARSWYERAAARGHAAAGAALKRLPR